MTAIPQFVEFLNENSPDLRVVGACAISKLAEQGRELSTVSDKTEVCF
jgi:hypothetical protein